MVEGCDCIVVTSQPLWKVFTALNRNIIEITIWLSAIFKPQELKFLGKCKICQHTIINEALWFQTEAPAYKWLSLDMWRNYFVSFVSNVSVFYRQPCANGGRCVLNNASSYTCICTPGWSGQNCRVNVNDCVRHWCQNGATCVDEIDGYRWVFKSRLSPGHSGPRMSMIVKAVTFTVHFLQGLKELLYTVLRNSL